MVCSQVLGSAALKASPHHGLKLVRPIKITRHIGDHSRARIKFVGVSAEGGAVCNFNPTVPGVIFDIPLPCGRIFGIPIPENLVDSVIAYALPAR